MTFQKLLRSIEKNDIPTASSLIANGFVNCMPSPLVDAVRFNRVAIATMLLDAGADLDGVDEFEQTAYHIAITHSRLWALELLLARGGDIVPYCESLLECAKRNADDRYVLILLDAGASVSFGDMNPYRMLGLAATSVAVMKRLLALNVDLKTLRDELGSNLCHEIAIEEARHKARHRDTAARLRWLVQVAGIDVDSLNNAGYTPSHYAAKHNNELALRVLIELGADLELVTQAGGSQGRTVLGRVCSWGFHSAGGTAEILLAAGADFSVRDSDGQSLCHLAASTFCRPVLNALLAAGADFDQPDDEGITPRELFTMFRSGSRVPSATTILHARRRIAKIRLDFVRHRALEICIGLQSLRLDALQLCEIMMQSCGALGSLIAFHQWWAIATQVKHFR